MDQEKSTARMPSRRILIVGSGVAGSILAFLLGKDGDYDIVVVERSPASQKLGQGIEIEEPALGVVQQMGIMKELEAVRTGEEGFELVNERGKAQAQFLASSGFSPTGALEMMRGDLTEVLYKAAAAAAPERVQYRFETVLQSLRQTTEAGKKKVIAELQDRNDKTVTTEEFDLVVGADGARSRTRQMIFGPSGALENCSRSVGAHIAYFSVPRGDGDWPLSKLCQFPGRRIIWMRPVGPDSEHTSVCLIQGDADAIGSTSTDPAFEKLRQANAANDRSAQKAAFAELYAGLGWEAPRVIEAMLAAKNFYSESLAQVQLPRWSDGRVALVGDSAWAPTPFTGQGNQLAILGPWVLAQELLRYRKGGKEISNNGGDDGDGDDDKASPEAAFARYEKRLRGYVTDAQEIPLGGRMPLLLNPQSSWGIWTLRKTVWLFSLFMVFADWTRLSRWFSDSGHAPFDLQLTDAQKEMVARENEGMIARQNERNDAAAVRRAAAAAVTAKPVKGA